MSVNDSEIRKYENTAVKTGMRFEYMFALLIPISLTVFAKKTKAREEAKMERARNADMILKLRWTSLILSLSKMRKTGRNIRAPMIF